MTVSVVIFIARKHSELYLCTGNNETAKETTN